ncbi:MAG TPA: YbaN family protein [Azospirillum sp.]|nr:YbaN family protein [Azospirillum sp.]
MTETQSDMSGVAPSRRPGRWAFLAVGYAALGLAVAGVVLPLLPTTPFLLVAAWGFAKSSPRLERWLYEHPRFGPFLIDWRERRAIPRRAKAAAVTGMGGSWGLLVFNADRAMVPTVAGIVMLAVAVYILTRPSPDSAGAE